MKEIIVQKNKIFKGVAVDFSADRVRLPNKNTAIREYMQHPGAVAVIAFPDFKILPKKVKKFDRIILVKQYRYAVKKVTYELPAGKLSKHEHLKKCVLRELKEETGYTAAKVKHVFSFWPTPAFSDELIHIFIAWNLKKGRMEPDSDEIIKFSGISVGRLIHLIKKGNIKDSKTMIALLGLFTFYKLKT